MRVSLFTLQQTSDSPCPPPLPQGARASTDYRIFVEGKGEEKREEDTERG